MNKQKLTLLALVLMILVGGWALPNANIKNVSADETDIMIETARIELTKADINIEYQEDLDPNELIVSGSYDKVELPIVDTNQLGTQVLTFIAIKGLSSVRVTKKVNVVDTQLPQWVNAPEQFTLKYDSTYDVYGDFSAVDNIDGELSVNFSGSFNPLEAGIYSLSATAKDSSGNEIVRDFTVEVQEKPKPKTAVGSKVSYSPNTYGAGWCTWHVADQRAKWGIPIPNTWGNAITWLGRAQAQGYVTGYAPAVGAIAYFPGANHVAFVEAVHGNGTVTISEMGWGYRAWGFNRRTISASSAIYIY